MESKEAYSSTSSLFSRDELEQQLQRILDARPFCDAPRLRKFLRFVVRKTVDDNPEVITSYEIAIDAFNRSPDFDPNDPYIRNIAVLVRKGLTSYYSNLATDSVSKGDIKIEIPRGNYLAKFSIIKNKAALSTKKRYLSWDHIEGAETGTLTKPKVTKLNRKSVGSEEHISVNESKSNSNSRPQKKPLLAISPFVSFGNEKCNHPEAIGEILAAEIITGFSYTDSFNIVSLLNSRLPQKIENHSLARSAIKADFLLNGRYQIAEGMILLNVELSENLPGATSQKEFVDSKATIIYSELLRIELDSFYLERNDEIQRISERLKVELSQFASADQAFNGLNSAWIEKR